MRDDAERRLESHDAATGGGNPDRAAPIAAECERHLPARERRRRASTRTATGRIGVEGIEGATEERAVGEGLVAELRGGGLADENASFGPESGDRDGIALRDGCFEEPRSHRGPHSDAHDQVLGGVGQSVQRAAPAPGHDLTLRFPCRFERLVVGDADEGVDARLTLVDAGEHVFHDLYRETARRCTRAESSRARFAASSALTASTARRRPGGSGR